MQYTHTPQAEIAGAYLDQRKACEIAHLNATLNAARLRSCGQEEQAVEQDRIAADAEKQAEAVMASVPDDLKVVMVAIARDRSEEARRHQEFARRITESDIVLPVGNPKG